LCVVISAGEEGSREEQSLETFFNQQEEHLTKFINQKEKFVGLISLCGDRTRLHAQVRGDTVVLEYLN
jgi:hypothetical protein